jgi:glycosyltransferase involved in cell wall biosynthesis
MVKRLIFISHYNVSFTPYTELPLPALAKDGWEITFVAPNAESAVLWNAMPYPCEVRSPRGQSSGSKLKREIGTFQELLAARFGNYDVIFLHAHSLATRAAIAFLGPMPGKRIVYHDPDYWNPVKFPLQSKLEGLLCRKIDCHLNHEYHRAYIYQERYRMTCPMIISPPNLPSDWKIPALDADKRSQMCGGKPDDQFVLMMHSPFNDYRMTYQLFEALAQLPDRFRLVMTGGSPGKRNTADLVADKLGISERVLQLHQPSFQTLLEYTVNADAGVLLYKNTDLGNFFQAPGRLTEYIACGLPLLASNFTGLENLVRRFDLGECVDATDPQRIAKGILELEASKRSLEHQPQRIRDCFEQHFAYDHWEPIVCKAFNDLLEDAPQSIASPSMPWIPGV